MSDRSPAWRVLESPDRAAIGSGPTAPPGRELMYAALAVGLAFALAGVVVAAAGPGRALVEVDAVTPTALPDQGEVAVEVAGAVARPGVYRLAPGARIADAIAAAGGYGPRVAVDRLASLLDLTTPISDGLRIIVPSRDDPPASTAPAAGAGPAGDRLLDLNAATQAELEALPGIGPVTAERIIEARAERAFSGVAELRERGLVGEKTFERIRALVTVR